MVDMKEKGERLRKLLKASNLTQVALAERVDTSDKYISQIVTGNKQLGPKTARKIAKVLKVNYEYLLGETDYPTEEEASYYSQETFYRQALTERTILASSLRILPMEPLDGEPWGSRLPTIVILKDTRSVDDDHENESIYKDNESYYKDFVCSYDDFTKFADELNATIKDIVWGKVDRFLKKCRPADELEAACMDYYDSSRMSIFGGQLEARSNPEGAFLGAASGTIKRLGEKCNALKEELDKKAPPE